MIAKTTTNFINVVIIFSQKRHISKFSLMS